MGLEHKSTSREPRDLQEAPQRPPRHLQNEPRGAQETPKGNPREPKAAQEHPKGAQRLPKGVEKDVGGAPKHKKGNLQQTSLLMVFELHKGHPGTPRRRPKIIKTLEDSTHLHQSMPKRTKRAPKDHREWPREVHGEDFGRLGPILMSKRDGGPWCKMHPTPPSSDSSPLATLREQLTYTCSSLD